jgi:hypothetical protein
VPFYRSDNRVFCRASLSIYMGQIYESKAFFVRLYRVDISVSLKGVFVPL